MSTQSLQALRDANHIRYANARTRREIRRLSYREGRKQVARMLVTDESREFEAMRVEYLLLSIRRFSHTATEVALRRIGVTTHDKRVRELTPRQRVELAELLAPEVEEWAA